MRSWRPHSGRTTHRRGNYRDKRDERRAWSQARAHQAPGRTREARAAKRLPRTLSALAACTASAGPRSSGFPYGAGAHRKGRRAGRHLEPGRNPSRRRYPPTPRDQRGGYPLPTPGGFAFHTTIRVISLLRSPKGTNDSPPCIPESPEGSPPGSSANSENSKAKPIAAHLKSCGIWEKFGRAVEKNSKQISESASELSVRNGHFALQSSNVTSNSEPLLTLKERRRGPKPQLEAHRHQCAGCLSRAHVNKGAEICYV